MGEVKQEPPDNIFEKIWDLKLLHELQSCKWQVGQQVNWRKSLIKSNWVLNKTKVAKKRNIIFYLSEDSFEQLKTSTKDVDNCCFAFFDDDDDNPVLRELLKPNSDISDFFESEDELAVSGFDNFEADDETGFGFGPIPGIEDFGSIFVFELSSVELSPEDVGVWSCTFRSIGSTVFLEPVTWKR